MDGGHNRLASLGAAVAVGALFFGAARAAGPAFVDLAIVGHANAQASVAAQGSFVAVAWAASTDGSTDVYTAISRDGGRRFAKPVRVSDATTHADVSGEQPPRVAVIPRADQPPAIVVVWTAKGSKGTRLLFARSNDGGTSFRTPTTIPGTDAPGNRGWESIAADPKGRVVAIWLDHRDYMASSGSGPMHHDGQAHTGHGDMAQQSKLYATTIGRDDARAIASGVCYCCKTSVATGADGAIYAAWRHVYPGNIRDIAFTSSHDDGRTFAAPVPVSHDQWALDGCPENGPALGVDADGVVHVVWPTLVKTAADSGEPNLALFYAAKRGEHFSARQLIDTVGTPRHPTIAIGSSGSLLVAWDEQTRGSRRVAFAVAVPAGGSTKFTRLPDATQDRGEYPAVAATSGGFVGVWTNRAATSTIRVQQINDLR